MKETTAAEKAAEQNAKRARFLELGSVRVSKAVKAISLIGNLANPHGYSFNAQDVQDVKTALAEEVKNVVDRFTASLSGKTSKQATTFKFGAQKPGETK